MKTDTAGIIPRQQICILIYKEFNPPPPKKFAKFHVDLRNLFYLKLFEKKKSERLCESFLGNPIIRDLLLRFMKFREIMMFVFGIFYIKLFENKQGSGRRTLKILKCRHNAHA